MGKILVVGSTTVDIVIEVDHLPTTAEDILLKKRTMEVGGCAFNAAWVMRGVGEPYELFTPVGTGLFGDYVREQFALEDISTRCPPPDEENGCCYCLVEPSGERTFIAQHGAEFAFYPEWFDLLDMDEYDSVYVCGFEVGHSTGGVVVDFLERRARGKTIYFAPSSRIAHLPIKLVQRLLDLHPVVHLNEGESLIGASRFAGVETESIEEAARAINRRTGSLVVVTLGSEGCWYETGSERGNVPGVRTHVVDTVGAGDAHVGALMAYQHRGLPLEESLARANRIASEVVASTGAHLDASVFTHLDFGD